MNFAAMAALVATMVCLGLSLACLVTGYPGSALFLLVLAAVNAVLSASADD